jgi:predicted N-acetyltransferase YhbS
MIAFDERAMRPYRAEDLDGVLRFVGACNAKTDTCARAHPGDVVHFMSNTLRGRDLERHVFLYEANRRLRALLMITPGATHSNELLVDPDLRGSDAGSFESAALAWSERAAWAAAQAAGGVGHDSGQSVAVEVTEGDHIRQAIVERLGYRPTGSPGMLYTTRSLRDHIPEKALPAGFSMRSVAGEQEAGAVAAVHNGAFTPKWDAEQYLAVMRTPGFDIERELVMVAPDGRFAAFLIIWLDPISRSGLFEPVGCHHDFQRRGLTSALMYEGMRRMRAAGMETAIVLHNADNVAGVPFYRSVGFQPRYTLAEYRKPMP